MAAPPPRPTGPRVVAFFAAKGGVGSTTLAVNTAICLAGRGACTVALMDLDPWWGQSPPSWTWPSHERRRAGVTSTAPTTLRPSEPMRSSILAAVSVFTSPIRPDTATPPTPDQLERVLVALAQSYDYVGGRRVGARRARLAVVLARADIGSSRSRRETSPCARRGCSHRAARRVRVPCRAPRGGAQPHLAADLVRTDDLRRSLQLPIDGEIPYDPLLFLKAANEGIPVAISAPSSPPTQVFHV
ncbi:MAG: AAA family ATPase [Chloroflexota bacterium]